MRILRFNRSLAKVGKHTRNKAARHRQGSRTQGHGKDRDQGAPTMAQEIPESNFR
jgi:hypothetical protein